MNISVNLDQAKAFGRHVLTFAAGGVTLFAAIHVISPGDAGSATQALSDIGEGATKIIAGVTTLIGLVSALWAAWSASPLSQLVAVSKNPGVEKVIVTDPKVAASVPSNKVDTQ